MKAHFAPARLSHLAASAGVLLAVLQASVAHAWSLSLDPASRRVYLHVGNGTAGADNSTINLVQVSVPGAQLGNGVAQAMTSNSTQSTSLYGDGYTTCPTPSTQVMVGASYQRSNSSNGPASATLSVTSPASLVSAAGDTIPFSQISWTVSAAGSSVPGVIPAGTFSGATQTLTTVPANRYIENCHTFRYANSALRAAGTYTGQVTYTITSP
jgi:hypothetical protein